MIVPTYWSEFVARGGSPQRPITVRRFGWSDESHEAATAHAQSRALEALRRAEVGERIPRRERKVAYGGGQGIPIREEIILRDGETVVTRNAYGALCLNTPHVLFADVDFNFRQPPSLLWYVVGFLVAATTVIITFDSYKILAVLFLLLSLHLLRGSVRAWKERTCYSTEQLVAQAVARLRAFHESHPDWGLRVYRTPAGLRILVTHRTFDPRSAEVIECFDGLGVDPVYRDMCLRQLCFRARVSPKPWRIGLPDHITPRPGVWPISDEKRPRRDAWIARYTEAAESFASCAYLETLGNSSIAPEVAPVLQRHDEMSRAEEDLPIA